MMHFFYKAFPAGVLPVATQHLLLNRLAKGVIAGGLPILLLLTTLLSSTMKAGAQVGSCPTPSFGATANFGAGTNPQSVTTADFNRDGIPDMATANNGSSNVSVLIGNGAGNFGTATNFAAGTGAYFITTGDFNNDGKVDIVTANFGANTISVLVGNGNGGFSSPVNFTVGNAPASIVVGDFNRDGRADIVTANYSSDNISILRGDGNGGFLAAVNFSAGDAPASIVRGDFNGDGKQDLATANYNANNVSVLLGNGTGGFANPVNFATGSRPQSLTATDFNGDGKQDLATASSNANYVSVLMGNGAGSFATAVNFAVGTNPFSIISQDVSGDGKADIIAANRASNNVSVLLGNGAGSFAAPVNFATGTTPYSVITSDFNRDGKPDLAIANSGTNNVSVLLNTCTSTCFATSFAPSNNLPAGNTPESVITEDFNGDGKLDIASANYNTGNISVSLGNGGGGFTNPGYFTTSPNPNCIITGDFNRDGIPDLATTDQIQTGVSVLMGNGTGGFSAPANFNAGTTLRSVTTGDFNEDGKPDLATAGYGSSVVSIFIGNGAGSFAAPVNFTTGTNPYAITTGDFNGDGKPDLATANYNASNVSVLLGNGAGGFATPVNFAAGSNPVSVTTGDFNRDGKADIATANSGSNNVSVLIGNGAGGFAAPVNITTGTNPMSVITTDFNRDGKADIATANFGSSNVSVLLGNGAGSFTASGSFAAGNGTYSITSGDFDGDGKPDLATANYYTSNVSVVLNTGGIAKPVITPSGPTSFCAGGTVTLSAPAGYTSYQWSPGGQTTPSITTTQSGNFKVTVTNSGGCTAVSDIVSVTVNAVPAKPVITVGGPTTFCAGSSVALSVPPGLGTYQWSPYGPNSYLNNAGSSGKYTVKVVSSAGCVSVSSDTVVVFSDTVPSAVSIVGPLVFCAGGSVALSAPAGLASYLWNPGGQTTTSINATQTGNYTVTTTDTRGCSSVSDQISVRSDTLQKPSIAIGGPITFCVGDSLTLSTPMLGGDVWIKKDSFPGNGRDQAVGFSIGDRGYISIGYIGGYGLTTDTWEYNPSNGTWSQKVSNYAYGSYLSTAFSIGNKAYIATGFDDYGAMADVWEYNRSKDVLTKKRSFPTNRYGAASFRIGNKGYLCGGISNYFNNTYETDLWEYDPATDAWTQKADFAGEYRAEAAGFSIGNIGYVGCGETYPSSECLYDFWAYNPATNTWTRKADFGGDGRYGAAAFSIGNKGYIGTGSTYFYGELADFWEYNPNTDIWTRKADFGGGKKGLAASFSIGNKGYVGTGSIYDGNRIVENYGNDFWEYTPSYNYNWSVGGQTTPAITITQSGNYAVRVTNGMGCSAVSDSVVVNVTSNGLAPNLATDNTTASYGNTAALATNCRYIALVTSNGTSPVSGSIAATAFVENAELTTGSNLYIRRHVQITPDSNATTATGRVTLFALQSEFNSYNAISTAALPASPTDAAGISHLRIYKYSGTSSNGSGLPGTYTGTPVAIDPADADIVWNSTGQYWQISFNVTGFSGFFIGSAGAVILPVQLVNFSAAKQGNNSLLSWQVVQEESIATYTIERSADGNRYTSIGSVASLGNTTTSRSYQFTDASVLKGANYYRLKITEKDGRVSYSEIRLLNFGSLLSIAVFPNPAKEQATITGVEAGMSIRLLDAVGKVLRVQTAGGTTETLVLSSFAKGVYSVQVYDRDGSLLRTARLVKE